MKLAAALLATAFVLGGCVVEPDHDRVVHDREVVHIDNDHHDDHHCDRDHDDHCDR